MLNKFKNTLTEIENFKKRLHANHDIFFSQILIFEEIVKKIILVYEDEEFIKN